MTLRRDKLWVKNAFCINILTVKTFCHRSWETLLGMEVRTLKCQVMTMQNFSTISSKLFCTLQTRQVWTSLLKKIEFLKNKFLYTLPMIHIWDIEKLKALEKQLYWLCKLVFGGGRKTTKLMIYFKIHMKFKKIFHYDYILK